jgi:hypothetical protein
MLRARRECGPARRAGAARAVNSERNRHDSRPLLPVHLPARSRARAGCGDPCASASELPAEVERSAETITITVTPPLTGCEPFRYVIKNDGSGGVRMNRRGDRWLPNGFDHDLTPAK